MRVQLLGRFSIEQERTKQITLDPAARPLASFLFTFPNRSHRRDKIIDLFWRDRSERAARASLSRTSWRIRQRLSQCSPHEIRLRANLSEICLELRDPNIVDAHRFRASAQEALSGKQEVVGSDALDRAVGFYGGPFLEDYDDEWVLNQRERLQSLYLCSLTKLMGFYARQNRIEAAIACGRRILACDPMRETIQRAVMILYVWNSQRGEAILQFARCKKALRQECDVDPAPETCALLRLIQSGEIFTKLSDLVEKEIARTVDADPALLRL